MLRLLVDDRWRVGGIKRYSEELLARLDPEFQVQGLGTTYPLNDPLTPLKLTLAIKKSKPDVFWSPGFMPVLSSAVPFLFTMHDMIHVKFDGGIRGLYYNSVIRPLAKKAFRIISVSAFSQGEICEWTGLPPERVPIIPNGVDSRFSPQGETFNPGYPYLLYVGARKAHKNIEAMLSAYARSGLSGTCRLLLSGEPAGGLQALALKLGIGEDLRFAGFIPEAKLPAYYRGAEAVVMVSTYEGFGLPLLEAMASGVPVLSSNTTSLGEIGGDGALLVNPLSVDEIAEGMQKITGDSTLRRQLIEKGLRRSENFQWDRSAASLGELLLEACAAG
jgi:glycosyltransferase involved in cell wall biosynthesis